MKHIQTKALFTLFGTWLSARDRTCNPENANFTDYGGRGIVMCDRWLESFDAFVVDMGVRPEGMSLDRVDVNLGYSPENCRWANRHTQARNKRNTKITPEDYVEVLRFVAEGHSARAIAIAYGVTAGAITNIMSRAGVRSVRARLPGAKLTRTQVDEIRALFDSGVDVPRPKALAARYGIGVTTLYNLLSGRTWKD